MNIQWWTAAGKYFGYPDCCIQDFLDRCENDKPITELQDEICYEGFVPCNECCQKVKEGSATLPELIKNRIHPKPFPNDNLKDFYSFMRKQGFDI